MLNMVVAVEGVVVAPTLALVRVVVQYMVLVLEVLVGRMVEPMVRMVAHGVPMTQELVLMEVLKIP
jgi:hypothetical protein